MIIKPDEMTKQELKYATQAVESSTYLMNYCGYNLAKDKCARCVFLKKDGCAIGDPRGWKPLKDKEEGKK